MAIIMYSYLVIYLQICIKGIVIVLCNVASHRCLWLLYSAAQRSGRSPAWLAHPLHLSKLPKPSTARHNLANAPLYLRDLQKGKV